MTSLCKAVPISAAASSNPGHRTALGFAESSDLLTSFPASFAGQTVDNSAVLIRYTLYGDATLNRSVDTLDFNLLATNFGKTAKRWFNGDFDYTTTVDTLDFNLLATSYGQSIAAPVASASQIFSTSAIGHDILE